MHAIIKAKFPLKYAGMVSGRKDALPHQDYLGWILERLALFHVRPA